VPPSATAAGRRRLTALRLVAQRISASDLATPGDAARWMLAMQGQDWPGAKWSIGLRAPGSTEATVEGAFDSGDIVRSWPMRGTLHVVPAEDLGWMLSLTTARSVRSVAARRALLGITEADVERARDAAVAALAGGRRLSRDAMLAAIAAGGASTDGQRGYHLLWYLAQTGTLVMGPTDGGQQAFVLLDEWIRSPRRLERDEALGELAFRYFRSHGPATVGDLVRWSGLTVADVRRGLSACDGRLASIEVDGVALLLASEALDARPPSADLHLLPGFDEYILGYRDRSAALAAEHADAIVPGGNGMFKPTIVADGAVIGTWRRTVKAREVVIEPTLFDAARGSHRAGLARAARAYGAYLGRPATVADGGAAGGGA
jgi:hypothetical protein